MLPRALACAAGLLLAAACRGSGERIAPEGARALGPLDARPLPLGPEFGREVSPRFVPALEALQRAVGAGEDELARSLVAHLDTLGPDERVWQLTRAFERILDGRTAVRSLHLALRCAPEPLETILPGALENAQAWRLVFTAENTTPDPIELNPGPATLLSTRTELSRASAIAPLGSESNARETRSFDRLKHLALAPGATAEIELARFFLAPRAGELAVRLSFELELRSGVLLRAGRELPATRLAVEPAQAVRLAPGAEAEPLGLDELLARSAEVEQASELLALALRVEPARGTMRFAELETRLAELPRPALERWIPALRWLVPGEVPSDVDGLRFWLREREESRARLEPRPDLVLPRPARAEPSGGD